jgi:hypothetical protein
MWESAGKYNVRIFGRYSGSRLRLNGNRDFVAVNIDFKCGYIVNHSKWYGHVIPYANRSDQRVNL